jgi:hypothetical protein
VRIGTADYRRKVGEMVRAPPKDGMKLTRNAEKLAAADAAHLNVKNELVARMQALLAERNDFANAPLLQLLDFQRSFYGALNTAVTPFAAHTYEGAMLDAEARFAARATIQTEALAAPVAARPAASYLGAAAAAPDAYSCCGGAAASAAPPVAAAAVGDSGAAAPPPPPRPKPPPPPGRPPAPAGGVQMRAITAYAATDARMLSFAAGEMMVKEKEEGGWFYGKNARGDSGYFPATYVEPL